MHYEDDLKTKDLKTFFKPFASLQNRILIDYKRFRDYLLQKIKDRDSQPVKNLHSKKNSQPEALVKNNISVLDRSRGIADA